MNPKSEKKRRPYPPKHRKMRADLIRKTRPWTASTGPTSDAGKAVITANALKSGLYTAQIKQLRRALKQHAAQLRAFRLL